MKRLFILFFFLTILSFWANAQVTLNQVTLKYDSSGWDSAFVNYTSFLGELDFIGGTLFNDPNANCVNDRREIVFRGLLDTISITKDTSFKIGYFGSITHYFSLVAFWDTSTVPPRRGVIMDSNVIDNCYVLQLNDPQIENQVNLYPNPTSGILNIAAPVNQYHWQMIDALGKTVLGGSVNQSVKLHQISMADIPKGVYFLRLQIAKEMILKKVVKH